MNKIFVSYYLSQCFIDTVGGKKTDTYLRIIYYVFNICTELKDKANISDQRNELGKKRTYQ